ncbi:MAG TPA: hypothetical protein VM536_19000 [Chloroflexia bacterium]|nr:hypothetical protein [Chloroflexia bacterium]
MKTIATVVTVSPDGALSGHVPPGIPPGEHQVLLVLDAAPTTASPPQSPGPHLLLDFPVDDVGPWPADLSLRREDLYDDDGR